jgi:class 3 adenylate cyclase
MLKREFHYRWEWELRSAPEALWPLATDTNRFNRDTGLPPVEEGGMGLNARRRLRFRKLGLLVEWEEEPFEWVRPHRFGVVRRYAKGPVAQMRVLAELEPGPEGGTRLVYQAWLWPRTLLGLLAIPIQVGQLSARSFERVFRQYDELASRAGARLQLPLAPQLVRLAGGGQQRLQALRQSLLAEGAPPKLLDRLVEHIAQTDDLSAGRMRPYELADAWGAPRRQVLELCLLSTRVGLLEFEWDLLCPLCRGAKVRSPSLGGIVPQVHCDTCNIEFAVNFERAVELTFHPNPAIRPIQGGAFCVAGPQTTPHVVVQQLLAPGAERVVRPRMEPGRHRLRAPGLPGAQFIRVAEGGLAQTEWKVEAQGWSDEEQVLAPEAALRFANATGSEQLLVLERTAWSDQAATAAEVTALQRFRDLFAEEALRPGEKISVGSLTVLFTDLCGSTRLYNQIGDAPAFGLVMSHFDVLLKAIAEEEGALVKTIGDAVMAVFRRPVSALRAMLRAQRELAASPETEGLQLKVGMHYGPCIAVTLNERLDYFGSTVNMASRLEHLSKGGDLVLSSIVREDPEVDHILAEAGNLRVEPLETELKGFDQARFSLWRVIPE